MFDPVVGRFLQEDPIDFAAGDPNLFRYVGNSPTNATDPSGARLFIPKDEIAQWKAFNDKNLYYEKAGPDYYQIVVMPAARTATVHSTIADFLGKKGQLNGEQTGAALIALYGGRVEFPNPNYTADFDRIVSLKNGSVSPTRVREPGKLRPVQGLSRSAEVPGWPVGS